MNSKVIIPIIIIIVIGIGIGIGFSASDKESSTVSEDSVNVEEIDLVETSPDEGKSFKVELSDSVSAKSP